MPGPRFHLRDGRLYFVQDPTANLVGEIADVSLPIAKSMVEIVNAALTLYETERDAPTPPGDPLESGHLEPGDLMKIVDASNELHVAVAGLIAPKGMRLHWLCDGCHAVLRTAEAHSSDAFRAALRSPTPSCSTCKPLVEVSHEEGEEWKGEDAGDVFETYPGIRLKVEPL